MHSDNDRGRLEAKQQRARISAVRARMLDLYEEDRDRSMNPQGLVEVLTREGWEVNLSQVNYHLRKLQDAELVPAPCLGN
jgi:Fe2+ or Zn2+ uptake regulation protein